MRRILAIAAIGLLASSPALAQQKGASPGQAPARGANPDMVRKIEVMNTKGESVGTVTLRQLAHGLVVIADLEGLPPGVHGFHIHERGVCEPPSFQSAHGHYRPRENKHGFDSPEGYHAGDLPNLHVMDNGKAKAEFHTTFVSLAPPQHWRENIGGSPPYSLLDNTGSAIVVHKKGDDYQAATPDSSGARIACGVIAAPA